MTFRPLPFEDDFQVLARGANDQEEEKRVEVPSLSYAETVELIRALDLRYRVKSEGESVSWKVLPSFGNTCKLLRSWSPFTNMLRYNEMTLLPEYAGTPIYEPMVGSIREGLEATFLVDWPKAVVEDAIRTVSDEKRYHPVREFLTSLRWDGERRVHRVAEEILGLVPPDEDGPWLESVMIEKWFIATVARALDPGCKVDTALVLQGPGGLKKSQFFAVLGGKWFSDTHMNLANKDSYQQLHAAWIYEWGEIDKYTRGRAGAELKAFLSSPVDNFRAPYDRATKMHPRTTVVVGSTNEEEVVEDTTDGMRRYWIIPVRKPIDKAKLISWRDQLWAEAVLLYEQARSTMDDNWWWLSANEDDKRRENNERYEAVDAWEAPITSYLSSRQVTHVSELLSAACGLHTKDHRKPEQMRAACVLRRLGWKKGFRTMVGKARIVPWFRPQDGLDQGRMNDLLRVESRVMLSYLEDERQRFTTLPRHSPTWAHPHPRGQVWQAWQVWQRATGQKGSPANLPHLPHLFPRPNRTHHSREVSKKGVVGVVGWQESQNVERRVTHLPHLPHPPPHDAPPDRETVSFAVLRHDQNCRFVS